LSRPFSNQVRWLKIGGQKTRPKHANEHQTKKISPIQVWVAFRLHKSLFL
jgi:hypothetical protein